MRKGLGLVFLIALVLATTAPNLMAQPAGDCSIPPGLGASLLIPYFEVDLADTNGVTTVFSINNGSSNPTLVRVVLWTDWGIAALAFDVWLAPFDVQTINVRTMLDGTIPSTGDGADLSSFDFCDAFPPSHANPVVTGEDLTQLRADFTGTEGPVFGDCIGEAYGDNVARGYITADVVDECSGVEANTPFWTPRSSNVYFDDGDGSTVAINVNRLWGDYTYLDFTGAAAQGSPAIALWADDSVFAGPDQYTFYGRFHDYDGRDHRVPLPYRFNQRFLNGGAFGGGADLIVWRDPEENTAASTCGVRPPAFPLRDGTAILDEEGNLFATPNDTLFPIATQRTSMSAITSTVDFGFIQVDSDTDTPSDRAQMWVETTLAAGAFGFSASWPGAPVSFLCGSTPSTD